jgi:DNA polymerase III epsilon subunit-like protein
MRHAMVDIETLSSAPDAAVVGIGLVVFTNTKIVDWWEGYIDPNEAIGTRSDTTKEWWSQQHKIVHDTVFGGIELPETIAWQMSQFIEETKPHTIWAGPVTFDVPILRNLFRQVNIKFPFHYRAERDCRTLMKLAKEYGMKYDGVLERTEERLGTRFFKHNPLHDAMFQTIATQKALNYLNPSNAIF